MADADLGRLSTSDIVTLASSNGVAPAARRAVVAPNPEQYGLARMYQAYREMAGAGSECLVCRSLAEALAWVGVEDFDSTDLIIVS